MACAASSGLWGFALHPLAGAWSPVAAAVSLLVLGTALSALGKVALLTLISYCPGAGKRWAHLEVMETGASPVQLLGY